jgi:2-oxoglutarate ferredoxin oxidoreductase subunit delta
MAKAKGDIVIDVEKCKGCELCIVACPAQTLGLSEQINKKGYRFAAKMQDNCTGCASCSLVCPEAIITVYRTVS